MMTRWIHMHCHQWSRASSVCHCHGGSWGWVVIIMVILMMIMIMTWSLFCCKCICVFLFLQTYLLCHHCRCQLDTYSCHSVGFPLSLLWIDTYALLSPFTWKSMLHPAEIYLRIFLAQIEKSKQPFGLMSQYWRNSFFVGFLFLCRNTAAALLIYLQIKNLQSII